MIFKAKVPLRFFPVFLSLTLIISFSALGRSKKNSAFETVQKIFSKATVESPKDLEVCFSPGEFCDVKLIKFIDSAKKSLDIAIYDITLDELSHHILVQSKKIPVRMVVDKRQAKGPHSLVKTLKKGGINIRYGFQRGIMHNKFTIVDSQAVETGSFNYTNHATRSNNENQIYLWNPSVVERYKRRFEEIWKEALPIEP